jgi:hypothetical protein
LSGTEVLDQTADAQASGIRIPRQARPATVAEQAEFEKERERFAKKQDEYFATIGEDIRKHILAEAGFNARTPPANAADALKIIDLWGLSKADLVGQLPQIGASLSTQVQGSNQVTTLQQQADQLTAALSKKGQQTFEAAMKAVRTEPFWRKWLNDHQVFIFPDLTGTNRYSGYTQRSSDRWNPGFIIHVSKDALDAGDTQAVVATLIHELSHTTFEGTIGKAMRPFLKEVASLLADHPEISALRAKASDKDEARQTHVNRIYLILYERTGYAEGEIFVHLQQFTHQPAVTLSSGKLSADRFILSQVAAYVEQLKRIRLPQKTLIGVLDTIGRRVQLLYDSRIEALPAGSPERGRMELRQRQAAAILELARSETGTDR